MHSERKGVMQDIMIVVFRSTSNRVFKLVNCSSGPSSPFMRERLSLTYQLVSCSRN
jgi:hypothetical protein